MRISGPNTKRSIVMTKSIPECKVGTTYIFCDISSWDGRSRGSKRDKVDAWTLKIDVRDHRRTDSTWNFFYFAIVAKLRRHHDSMS